MTSPSEQVHLELNISSPQTFQDDLDAAVARAQIQAVRKGQCGILITRHSYTHFTIDLSEEVPFGITRFIPRMPGAGNA